MRRAEKNIAIRPTSGGEWKSLVSLREAPSGYTITPDGNWLLYGDVDSAGNRSLFRVATAGGTPERLGTLPLKGIRGPIEISPDGSKILVSVSERGEAFELWSLENFVPPVPKR